MNLEKIIGTSRRTKIFTALTAIIVIAALALNFLLTAPMQKAGLRIDNTFEKLYTPTDAFMESCEAALSADGAPEVTMTFCTDPDVLTKTAAYRVTYYLALNVAKRFDNFTVKTVNVKNNPTAVAKYKTTSRTEITAGDVILSSTYGEGDFSYRIAPLSGFWVTNSEGTGYYSYDGEYRFVSLLYSVLATQRPTAYFITGHGETVYDVGDPENSTDAAALYELLRDGGMQVKTLNVSEVSEIPEDCVLLILNNPQEDFGYDESRAGSLAYESELEKIDRYLIDRQGAMIVAKDHAVTLPNLEVYLNEWGFSFRDVQIAYRTDDNRGDAGVIPDKDGTGTVLSAQYDTEEDSYGDSIYHEISAYASAARTVLSDCGDIVCSFYGVGEQIREDGTSNTKRVFAPLFSTTDKAVVYAKGTTGEYNELLAEGKSVLAATSARIEKNSYSDTDRYAYVCCASTKDLLSNESLGNTSFANRDVLALLIRNISRVDEYASDALGGVSLNSDAAFGKILYTPTLNEETAFVFENGEVYTQSEAEASGTGIDVVRAAASKELHAMTDPLKKAIAVAACTAPVAILAVCAYVLIRRKNR